MHVQNMRKCECTKKTVTVLSKVNAALKREPLPGDDSKSLKNDC